MDVLLDNQATVSIFHEERLLEKIRPTKDVVRIAGIGGSIKVNECGDFNEFGTVYFSAQATANVLSFANVREKFPVNFHNTVTILSL